MPSVKIFCAIIALVAIQPAFAQISGPRFGSKAAQDFFFYVKKAQDGHDIKATAAGKFLEEAKKSVDLRTTLDSYFKSYNEEAARWLKDNKITVSFAPSMDGLSKAIALNRLHENFRQRSAVKYDGPVQISLFAGESAKNHLKLISADAYERLGYNEAQNIGNSNVFIKAPEGWKSYKTQSSSESKKQEEDYVFTMPDGSEQIISIPTMKSVVKVYTRRIKTNSSEEQNSDGSRSVRQSTEISGAEFTGFLIQNADIKSQPGSRFVVINKNDDLTYLNNLGDLSEARQVYVSSAEEAIDVMKKLKETKKISSATSDLFNLLTPPAQRGCEAQAI